MKQMLALTSVMMLLVCSGCGGDTHESLVSESLATMKKIVSVLDGVKDEATATAAKPELKSLMDKFQSINARQEKLPAPTEAEGKAIEQKYGKDLQETGQKFQQNMMRVSFDPKIAAVLQDIGQNVKPPTR